jgi:hypothetical protein
MVAWTRRRAEMAVLRRPSRRRPVRLRTGGFVGSGVSQIDLVGFSSSKGNLKSAAPAWEAGPCHLEEGKRLTTGSRGVTPREH